MTWFGPTADGIVVAVRLTPRGGRDVIDRPALLADGREVLAVRVRVPPEDGAANAALIALIAKTFKVAKAAVALTAGAASRVKQVRIAGDPTTLSAVAEHLFED